MYCCNVLPEVMGNLMETDFTTLWNSPRARAVREKVSRCQEGCWMVCTARTVIKRHPIPVGRWVIASKIRGALGGKVIVDKTTG